MGMDIKEEVCEEEDGRELDGNLGEEETPVQSPVMVQKVFTGKTLWKD